MIFAFFCYNIHKMLCLKRASFLPVQQKADVVCKTATTLSNEVLVSSHSKGTFPGPNVARNLCTLKYVHIHKQT